jgi:hypothetical protein
MQSSGRALAKTLLRGVILAALLLGAEIVMVFLIDQFGFTRSMQSSIERHIELVVRMLLVIVVLVFGGLLAKDVRWLQPVRGSIDGVLVIASFLLSLWLIHSRIELVFAGFRISSEYQELYRTVLFGVTVVLVFLLLLFLYRLATGLISGRRSPPPKVLDGGVRCLHCGARNVLGSQFCIGCGQRIAPQVRVCDRCGTENPMDTRFCAGCGAPLAPVGAQGATAPDEASVVDAAESQEDPA